MISEAKSEITNMSRIKALLRDERGASMVEYSILIGIITAAAIATIVLVGGKVSTAWTTLNTAWTP
jgi:pilus assembly protein Flp/PilA